MSSDLIRSRLTWPPMTAGNVETRELEPLAEMANWLHIAVVAFTHLYKLQNRIGLSSEFLSAPSNPR
jgi:hypothetical protein